MSTIRSRITTAYAVALAGTLVTFGAALYGLQRVNARAAHDQQLVALGDRVERQVVDAQLLGEPLTEVQDPERPTASGRLRARLEGVPGYLFVLAPNGRALYQSWAVREMLVDDQRAELQNKARDPDTIAVGSPPRLITVAPSVRSVLMPGQPPARGDTAVTLRMIARRHPDFPAEVGRIVIGLPAGTAALSPGEVIAALLLVAPMILLFSVGGAYLIAGPAIRTNLDRIINEVEAITDGRSLHRRLPIDATADELARLTATLNAMMGRLETSFAALRRFTADASHELKTPLAVLRANVERAMSAPSGSTEQMVALEEALQEVARMASLVDALLTLARADEGRFDLHREPIAMEPLVHDVFETASILGEEAGLTVEMPVVEPSIVMGDATRLRQLFLNLVTNAIKYTPRGGQVTLSLVRRDETTAFTVRDTGIGIAAADLPHIFERFYRADRVRSRAAERGGVGLGLSISQWIVQAHGGHLTVSSRLGRGSTFTVTLPVQEAPVLGEQDLVAAESGSA